MDIDELLIEIIGETKWSKLREPLKDCFREVYNVASGALTIAHPMTTEIVILRSNDVVAELWGLTTEQLFYKVKVRELVDKRAIYFSSIAEISNCGMTKLTRLTQSGYDRTTIIHLINLANDMSATDIVFKRQRDEFISRLRIKLQDYDKG